jgi:hypothetical protein
VALLDLRSGSLPHAETAALPAVLRQQGQDQSPRSTAATQAFGFTCSFCQHENVNESSNCALCFVDRDAPAAEPVDEKRWVCHVCTFE